MGFTFRLRWLWALSAYAGLREMVDRDAVYTFEPWLPTELRLPPSRWSSLAITRHFLSVWKLLAWSRFCKRFDEATLA